MRRRTSALPFCGIMPTVRRSACVSIQEKMCEHDPMVCVSSRSWRIVKGNAESHASEAQVGGRIRGEHEVGRTLFGEREYEVKTRAKLVVV